MVWWLFDNTTLTKKSPHHFLLDSRIRDAKAIGNQKLFSGCCQKVIVKDSGYFAGILNLTFDGSTYNNRPKWCDTKPCDSDPKGCTYCLENLSGKWVIRWDDTGNRDNQVIFGAGSCTSELQLKVNCRKKNWAGQLGSQQLAKPDKKKFSYNSLSVYNSTIHFQLQFTCTWSRTKCTTRGRRNFQHIFDTLKNGQIFELNLQLR